MSITVRAMLNNLGVNPIPIDLKQFYGGNNVLAYNVYLAGISAESGQINHTLKRLDALLGGCTTFRSFKRAKNTQWTDMVFLLTDSTNHAPATAKTPAVTVSKDGATPVAATNAVAEISVGTYKITLTAAELNSVKFTDLVITNAGCDTITMRIEVA